ncbi:hypothetical protein [Scytonema sp. NUACC21]
MKTSQVLKVEEWYLATTQYQHDLEVKVTGIVKFQFFLDGGNASPNDSPWV